MRLGWLMGWGGSVVVTKLHYIFENGDELLVQVPGGENAEFALEILAKLIEVARKRLTDAHDQEQA